MSKYLQDNKIKEEVKEILKDKLDEYEDTTVYGCDLAYKLSESENCDGSYTYSSYKAKQWIKDNFEDLGEIVEEMEFQMGKDSIPNVFNNPENFQVVVLIEVACSLLSRCDVIDEHWNDRIELDEEHISIIKEQLEIL